MSTETATRALIDLEDYCARLQIENWYDYRDLFGLLLRRWIECSDYLMTPEMAGTLVRIRSALINSQRGIREQVVEEARKACVFEINLKPLLRKLGEKWQIMTFDLAARTVAITRAYNHPAYQIDEVCENELIEAAIKVKEMRPQFPDLKVTLSVTRYDETGKLTLEKNKTV
jgi:hypothetical protein